MREFEEIRELIVKRGESDERIRAILLNGSRANPKIKPDPYQDYDIVYIVEELDIFTSDKNWIEYFGEIILKQLPDTMSLGSEEDKDSFTYLMVFSDGNRIDLTLFPKSKLKKSFHLDSLTNIWLDKDGLFAGIEESSEKDNLIKLPHEKEFREICNEFWWVSPYVAKAIMRSEIIHAKEIMEIPVRKMFMRMIELYVGVQTKFEVSLGKGACFIGEYITEEEYKNILETYSNPEPENIIKSMRKMMNLFRGYANYVANQLEFSYDSIEEVNSLNYFDDLLERGKSR